ncbi:MULTISPECIES: GNAT family N-acetyltransferase [Halorussus]|uniref:GNAT family N-acetyltransferase n=1 Tax=Halorussus TaxID=1070314 RepID=UPI000E214596|nr:MULTISPECIES: GNAT family N-acetyltransferase [Halorussus]NHN58120.1 GNAT family N-acetyltransferase [Halorussus sp. JP-T4]
MEYALVGWPDDGPRLRLDHREFSYAGKFVMSNTGKAVVRDPEAEASDHGDDAPVADDGTQVADADWIADDRIVGAIAFNGDRTDPATAWLRYVTVRRDRRGDGLGARLARFATERLRERGYDRVQIAVNNPFAFHALSKAGFGSAGEETGLAELVMVAPAERTRERYQSGLDVYREREGLSTVEREFLTAKAGVDPPDAVPDPEQRFCGGKPDGQVGHRG